MRLSTRILVSYGYLATLLLVGAAGAAVGFHRLGDNIGQVLGDNFRSVQAGIDMLEALERQDSATLSTLLGQPGAGSRMAEADVAFELSLELARSNITIDGETEIVEEIGSRLLVYRRSRDALLAEPPAQPVLVYERDVVPRFEEIKRSVRRLIDVNHDAMQRADADARRIAIANAGVHALLVALALLSLAPLSSSMKRHVLSRLEEITAVSEAISKGDLGRRLDDRHLDELGNAARQINRVLDRHQTLEAEMSGHRSRHRALVRSLLEVLPERAVLFTPSGEVIASTLSSEAAAEVQEEAGNRVEAMEEAEPVVFAVGARRVELVPLKPAGQPQVAWLARVDEGSRGEEPRPSATPS